jgi:hypothetical protein
VAKGQQRSNREKRKPKADKKKAPLTQRSPFPPWPGMGKLKVAAGKRR